MPPVIHSVIYTLGHSNHPAEHFLHLLRLHGITAVADVRSSPYTKYARHLTAPALAARGVTVRHIRGDGRLESDESLRAGERDSLLDM